MFVQSLTYLNELVIQRISFMMSVSVASSVCRFHRHLMDMWLYANIANNVAHSSTGWFCRRTKENKEHKLLLFTQEIGHMLLNKRWCWLGQVINKDRGGRDAWWDCFKEDMKGFGLSSKDAQIRANHHHHHFWHAPLRVRSAKCRHQSPEWAILSHVDCFVQGEVKWFQILQDSLHPRGARASWWSPPVLQGGSC